MKKTNYNLQIILMGISTGIVLFLSFSILWFIVSRGIMYINIEFLTSTNINIGIFPMIISTIIMVLLSLTIGFTISLATAIYLSEYAKNAKWVLFAIDSLVSIPSIVYGLFGLSFFVVTLRFGFSILAGALTLTIMILPTLINTMNESLKKVPKDLKSSSYALGASKVQTIFRVILPTISNGIFTSIILAIGRIISESAPLILTAGAVYKLPRTLFSSARTLTTHLYFLITEPMGDNATNFAYASATVIIIIIIFLNLILKIIKRIMEKKQ